MGYGAVVALSGYSHNSNYNKSLTLRGGTVNE